MRLLLNKKGDGYVEVPPPEVLSYSSTNDDAAITFINSTAVSGVVFQHHKAFDIVASAKALTVEWHNV